MVREKEKGKCVFYFYNNFVLSKKIFCAKCNDFMIYEHGYVQIGFFTTTTTNLKNIFNIDITEMHIYFFKKTIVNIYFDK